MESHTPNVCLRLGFFGLRSDTLWKVLYRHGSSQCLGSSNGAGSGFATSVAEREASRPLRYHKLKIAGSNPVPATTDPTTSRERLFRISQNGRFCARTLRYLTEMEERCEIAAGSRPGPRRADLPDRPGSRRSACAAPPSQPLRPQGRSARSRLSTLRRYSSGRLGWRSVQSARASRLRPGAVPVRSRSDPRLNLDDNDYFRARLTLSRSSAARADQAITQAT